VARLIPIRVDAGLAVEAGAGAELFEGGVAVNEGVVGAGAEAAEEAGEEGEGLLIGEFEAVDGAGGAVALLEEEGFFVGVVVGLGGVAVAGVGGDVLAAVDDVGEVFSEEGDGDEAGGLEIVFEGDVEVL